MKKIFKIALPIIITMILSFIFIKFGKVDYEALNQPKYAPKSYVFSIIWSVIYLIMFISVYKLSDNQRLYKIFIVVLISHILWNFFFFFLGLFLVSLILLVLIFLLSWIFVYNIFELNKKLAYLNILYLLWLLLAIYLNVGITILN